MPSQLGSARSWQLPLAAAFATMASAIGLGRLIHPGVWVAIVLLVSLMIAAGGTLMRRFNVPRALIVLGQVLVVVFILTLTLVHGSAIAWFIPGPGALHALSDKLSRGVSDLRGFSPPAPETPGITALMALAGSGYALVIDILAVTLRRPVLAGAPILAVYLIPATREPGGLSWLAFTCAAIGYLTLIGTEGHERLGQWGRAVHQRTGRVSLAGPTNTGLTRRISAWSLAAALLIPLLIPTLPSLLHLSGGGPGSPSGGGGTIFLDQNVNIAQDLLSPNAEPLFSYRTSSPSPERDYIQQEVLTQFNGSQWSKPASTIPMQGGTVPIPGLVPQYANIVSYEFEVTVNGNFGFSTVPAPYATTDLTQSNLPAVTFDKNTLTASMGGDENAFRGGDHYTALTSEITPTIPALQTATVGHDAIGQNYLGLPSSVSGLLTQRAEQITRGATTPYQQALDIETYFLNNFAYSLDPKISGDGAAAIQSFLQTKKGFCQQFAATMAGMARALHIPAVVAIGYTPGTVQPNHTYQVSTHDAHAWPLLYFDGIGWVQFEPTPKIVSSNRAQAQPWTVPQSQQNGGPTAGLTATPTTNPTSSANAAKCANGELPNLHHIGEPGTVPQGCGHTGQGGNELAGTPFGYLGVFGAVPRAFERWFLSGNPAQITVKLLLLALFLLAGLPGIFRVRRWRKRRRLLRRAAAAGGPKPRLPNRRSELDTPDSDPLASRFAAANAARRELAFTAWEELREYATDLGFGWPHSDTPRELGGRLATVAEFDSESRLAVGRVTTLVERAVYAPDPTIEPDEARSLPSDVNKVRGALATSAGRAARLRAAVLPSSTIDQIFRRGKRE